MSEAKSATNYIRRRVGNVVSIETKPTTTTNKQKALITNLIEL